MQTCTGGPQSLWEVHTPNMPHPALPRTISGLLRPTAESPENVRRGPCQEPELKVKYDFSLVWPLPYSFGLLPEAMAESAALPALVG